MPHVLWRASGLRHEITNTCWPWTDEVFDQAASRREVKDVNLLIVGGTISSGTS
jgi:hypothetical protein